MVDWIARILVLITAIVQIVFPFFVNPFRDGQQPFRGSEPSQIEPNLGADLFPRAWLRHLATPTGGAGRSSDPPDCAARGNYLHRPRRRSARTGPQCRRYSSALKLATATPLLVACEMLPASGY
jgi:hypothetical protein